MCRCNVSQCGKGGQRVSEAALRCLRGLRTNFWQVENVLRPFLDFILSVVPLRFFALIHRPHLCALLRGEGELAAIEGEESLCTEAVNAAVDCL